MFELIENVAVYIENTFENMPYYGKIATAGGILCWYVAFIAIDRASKKVLQMHLINKL